VLKGAGKLLRTCMSLLIEVSTRQVYSGGVLFNDLEFFLSDFDLVPLWQPGIKSHENIFLSKDQITINARSAAQMKLNQ